MSSASVLRSLFPRVCSWARRRSRGNSTGATFVYHARAFLTKRSGGGRRSWRRIGKSPAVRPGRYRRLRTCRGFGTGPKIRRLRWKEWREAEPLRSNGFRRISGQRHVCQYWNSSAGPGARPRPSWSIAGETGEPESRGCRSQDLRCGCRDRRYPTSGRLRPNARRGCRLFYRLQCTGHATTRKGTEAEA